MAFYARSEPKKCLPQPANEIQPALPEVPPPHVVWHWKLSFAEFLRPTTKLGCRSLREAARLEPGWDRPPFELGQIYFFQRDCESALTWFSRVPPNRPDGPEASFDNGVCHLLRNDANRRRSDILRTDRSVLAVRIPAIVLPDLSEVAPTILE